jgi:N6-adenosine-specific RNA methylase IME4
VRQHQAGNLQPTREHSQKPAEARFRLEKLYGDVPRIELFSRCGAPGWDHWGNQAEQQRFICFRGCSIDWAKGEAA